MGYKKLDIWQVARENVNQVHEMTIQMLPKFEMYETGSQVCRSSKSVKANIVEGFGRRAYKLEFIRFLTFALASNYETLDHIETLRETKSLKDSETYNQIHNRTTQLSKMLYNFIEAVHKNHNSQKAANTMIQYYPISHIHSSHFDSHNPNTLVTERSRSAQWPRRYPTSNIYYLKSNI
jgi:four helix bundle protein